MKKLDTVNKIIDINDFDENYYKEKFSQYHVYIQGLLFIKSSRDHHHGIISVNRIVEEGYGEVDIFTIYNINSYDDFIKACIDYVKHYCSPYEYEDSHEV